MSDHAESETLKRSPLAEEHARLEARMAPFAGWEMPIQYAGIVAEHRAVRESVGIFDISHMGQVRLSGPKAANWLNGLLTNDLNVLAVGDLTSFLFFPVMSGVVKYLLVGPGLGVLGNVLAVCGDVTSIPFFPVMSAITLE